MIRRVRSNLLVVVSLLVWLAGRGGGAAAPGANERPDAATRPRAPSQSEADRRDVVVMLDHGPLHLRIYLSLNRTALTATRDAYVARLIQALDTNGDGKLVRSERNRSPLFRNDPRLSGGGAFLDPTDRDRVVPRSEILQAVERMAGETVVYRQDSTAAGNDREVFSVLDADGNGVLDEAEMAAAAKRIIERDEDQDECVTFEEFVPKPPEDERVVLRPSTSNRRRNPTAADLLRDVGEPLLPSRLIKRYDKDRDGQLSAEELGWSTEAVAALDKNGDGKLDAKELAHLAETPPDLEMAVELDKATPDGPYLRLLSWTGKRDDQAKRPDFARLSFANAALTLSFRETDPVPDAIANAMQTFRRLDLDGNGYLDRKETADPARFRRGLFDEIDADGDAKIFPDELKEYVTAHAEPATTSSVVTVYDLGYGFFQSLDRNGDGRISAREMRVSPQTLQLLRRPSAGGLAQNDGMRRFHVEIARGSYQLFGRPAEYFAALPTYEQRPPVGPIWFQRMDRNNDGDLTWNEFLGPREIFDRLDADHDGLIDPVEAEKAEGN